MRRRLRRRAHRPRHLLQGGAAGTFAAQALYHRDSPFTQISLNKGGSLSWGGLLQDDGTWLFAQRWDAPAGVRELSFYRSALVETPHDLR